MDKWEIERKMKILRRYDRPNSSNYINAIFDRFVEISGDRICGDDAVVLCGIALLGNIPVTVIGQQRGLTVEAQIKYNFSMTSPEGFRKSLRIMKQAEKFGRPVICFVDTIGAYPGRRAEEHGQATAISHNLKEMLSLRVPIISILIGHGGSGGALALCIADCIAVLENAVLSVISPKACAEILWKDLSKEMEATELLKMTSQDLLEQRVVEEIIPEPYDGAQSDFEETAKRVKEYLLTEISKLNGIPIKKLLRRRQEKYRKMGK